MKLKYYCGLYKPQRYSIFEEPEECYASGEIEVEKEEWEENMVCIKCPSCGGELHQNMDHFEIVKE